MLTNHLRQLGDFGRSVAIANRSMKQSAPYQNPYECNRVHYSAASAKTSRWMTWAGLIALILAGLCPVATVLGMMWSVSSIETSSSTPQPSELASDINKSIIPLYGAVPLTLIGISLLAAGLVRRNSVPSN